MAITGIHTMLYSPKPDLLRDTLQVVLGWDSTDLGDGLLVFGGPRAEVGAYPAETLGQAVTFACDDLESTVVELREKGIVFRGEPSDEGWGSSSRWCFPEAATLGSTSPATSPFTDRSPLSRVHFDSRCSHGFRL